MTLEEKAKEYALKALESEIDKVQKAYIDGYNAAKAEYNHEPIIDENGIKWYDMDLPSGNLWSEPLTDEENGGHFKGVYNQVKDLSLPTKEDFEELQKHTLYKNHVIIDKSSGHKWLKPKFISKNGLEFVTWTDSYWLKSDVENNEAYYLNFYETISNTKNTILYDIYRDFIGLKKKVMLIKRKN